MSDSDGQKYKIMTERQNIRNIISDDDPSRTLEELNAALQQSPDNPDLLVQRGRLLWRLNRRGEAISDYEKAAAADPDGPAKLLLEHTNSIMDFFNPDLLNP